MSVSAGSRSGRLMTEQLHLTKQWKSSDQNVTSPDRTVVWTEPSSSTGKFTRVPVVYYLSRNGQLEHPHFMEVPVSSQGLYLTDVINRLNVLRGNGMASMYSWSCKRSYKNGFVWHDLSESDFIYPAHGHEYVLKGSELPVNTFQDTTIQRQPLPPPDNQIAVVDPDYSERRRRNQSCSSIDFNLHEYSVYKAESAADASTQTDDSRRRRRRPVKEIAEEKTPPRDEIEISPPPSDSSPETLEKLMKADGRMMLRHETRKDDQTVASVSTSSSPQIDQTRGKSSSSSVLMQLISCGSISFKDCGVGNGGGMGLMSQYRMRVPPRGSGRVMKLEEKEYFSGSLVEGTKRKEIVPSLKRSTSYGANR